MGGGRFCPPFASGTPNVFYLPASLIRVYLLSYHFADQLVNLIFRTNNENICRNPLIWLSGRLLYKSEHIKSSQLWPISISLQIFHIYIIFFHICKIQKKQLWQQLSVQKGIFHRNFLKKFLDRVWCTTRNIWLIFENADIEIMMKCLVATKQVVGHWRSWYWWLKCLIFVFWKQWNETDFSFQQLWGQVQQKSLMSLKHWWVIGLFVVEIWILLHVIYPLAFSEMSKILHVIDPLNFSELSKIHWPFKAVVIESIYDEVSELEASQMTRRPRRILIGLICQSFKDGV